ncbi:uncharacterized protein LOC103576209 [Microplitis demolitor]|uniref:uncharacterized protein LOC103576209 n=1 Tax=Microplitis demolitor TaxID=69319 RepID=UPI0004CDB14E|nr:uncharacterized protein LOC103576209 [Microplitis demolitor]
MRLLHKTTVVVIAILGGFLLMVSSETEDRKYPIVEDINHRNEDNISNNSNSSSSVEFPCDRCVGKLEIEVTAHQAKVTENVIIKMDAAELKMFSNPKWTNITTAILPMRTTTSTTADMPSEKLLSGVTSRKQNDFLFINPKPWSWIIPSEVEQDNRVKRNDRNLKQEFPRAENLTQTIPDTKPQVDESVEIASDTLIPVAFRATETIRPDGNDEISDPNKKQPRSQNQLVDLDEPSSRKPKPMFTAAVQVQSAKQIFPSTLDTRNSTVVSSHSEIEQLAEATLETPLIVEPQVLGASMWLSKNASYQQEDDKPPYLKKDHSKPSINLVDGKPSKVFYEIKPSLNTAMDDDDIARTPAPVITSTKRSFLSGFKIPSIPSSFGKYGPYFLDDVDERNITERIGSTVLLDCRIGLLGDKKVTWLQHDKDSIRLLTVGNVQYSADERISLKFQYPDNWRLQIAYATLRDNGLYKCQVEIDPAHSLVKRYNVIITAPVLNITDDSGRAISGERHLKAGSALRLRCEGRDILERLNESLLWTRGDETLTSNVSENRTTEIADDKEISVIVSSLTIEKASPRHAGNYSCIVPERAKTTIAVHVLNGELPAAVHGSGVSRAVFNIWLIHLTISSGFFR